MVYIFLADGFEEIEALTQVDYLRRAGIEIKMVGIRAERICGAHGIPVICDTTIEKVSPQDENLEMIILPGGLGGVDGLSKCRAVSDFISYFAESGKYIAAICAAPTMLSKMGLLENRHAVCYPAMLDELELCRDTSGRIAKDGKFITAAAAGVSEEFAFAIIEELKGKETMQKVKESILAR